jgi:hypothetical protein
VPPALAAYYLNWSEYISWRDPRVRSYDQYLLADSNAGQFASGLEYLDGTPKPALRAYRLPLYLPVTRTSGGRSLEVWGCIRPARFARGTQTVAIEFRSTGTGGYRVLKRLQLGDPDGYFDTEVRFPTSGSVRLAWTYPNGQAIYSRIVGVTLS